MTPIVVGQEPWQSAESGRVRDLLRLRARCSSAPAFIHGATGSTLRWSDLELHAMAWEEHSEQLTASGQRTVGLLFDDPLATIRFLGALGTGIGVAPMHHGASPAEPVAQCQALGIQVVITDLVDGYLLDSLRASGCDLWSRAGADLAQRLAATGPRPPAPPGRAALLLARSGTTGRRKIIPLTEDQLLHAARNVAAHHELTATDRGYCPVPGGVETGSFR